MTWYRTLTPNTKQRIPNIFATSHSIIPAKEMQHSANVATNMVFVHFDERDLTQQNSSYMLKPRKQVEKY